MAYSIVVKMDQIVTKEIHLLVDAITPEKAQEKAREALQTYPDKVEVIGVDRILTTKMKYWIPRDIEFISTKRVG